MYKDAYKRAAQDALFSQSASNLSGLVYTMPNVADALNERRRELGKGTDWFATHPVMYLFAVQIGHLTKASAGSDSLLDYSKNCDICEKIARGEEVEGY